MFVFCFTGMLALIPIFFLFLKLEKTLFMFLSFFFLFNCIGVEI